MFRASCINAKPFKEQGWEKKRGEHSFLNGCSFRGAGILSGKTSDIMPGILSSISSDIFSGISSDILSGISRDILSGTSFDIPSRI